MTFRIPAISCQGISGCSCRKVSERRLVSSPIELLGNKLKILETLTWQAFERLSIVIAETQTT